MPLTQSKRDHDVRLVISGSFTIFQAADYKVQLMDVLEQAVDLLELDLSGIEEIDTAGLQLLLMLQREAVVQHKHVVISSISSAVEQVISLLQLQHRFNLPTSTDRVPA